MNITVRRILGGALAVFTLLYAFNIVRQIMSGAYEAYMLIFALVLGFTGLACVGIAFNFNNIIKVQNQPKTPSKPASPLTKVGGVLMLVIGGLSLIFSLSQLITSNPSLVDIVGDLIIPFVLIGFGIGILKRK